MKKIDISTPEAVAAFIAELRIEYPSPRSTNDGRSIRGGYSVGGAICRLVFGHANFPTADRLAAALIELNPSLGADAPDSHTLAHDYADQVIWLNDSARFDDAWSLIEEALNHRGAASGSLR